MTKIVSVLRTQTPPALRHPDKLLRDRLGIQVPITWGSEILERNTFGMQRE